MRHILARWGTPLIYWSFAITAVTGVLLYFRVHAGPTEVLHIWIGFLMIAALIPHLARNWKAFLTYFTKRPLYVALFLTIAISGAFAYPTLFGSEEQAGGPPGLRAAMAVTQQLSKAELDTLAPVLNADSDALVAMLEAAGITVDDTGATLDTIAEANGKTASDLLTVLFTAGGSGGAPADGAAPASN